MIDLAACLFALLLAKLESRRARCRKYHADNRKVCNARSKAYAETHRTEAVLRVKGWVQRNPAKRRKNARNYENRKRKELGHRLLRVCQRRIAHALHGGNVKSARTLNLLGCPISVLKTHLESKFQPDMSWENYGQWHVDHRRPCASFDLSDPAQQRECFHYSNLQPLWALDNLRKSDKIAA